MTEVKKKRPYAIMMVGRTAAGKTSTAKYLADKLMIEHIVFARYKRLAKNYRPSDSLREDLRDVGYRVGIQKSLEAIGRGKPVILDASFHKRKRRVWAYQALSGYSDLLIQIYCQTSNVEETRYRINSRKTKDCTAEHHASDFAIFEYIDASFDEPITQELQSFSGQAVQLVIDTFSARIIQPPSLSSVPYSVVEIYEHLLNYLSIPGTNH